MSCVSCGTISHKLERYVYSIQDSLDVHCELGSIKRPLAAESIFNVKHVFGSKTYKIPVIKICKSPRSTKSIDNSILAKVDIR
jgi:hypothetical protein